MRNLNKGAVYEAIGCDSVGPWPDISLRTSSDDADLDPQNNWPWESVDVQTLGDVPANFLNIHTGENIFSAGNSFV